MWIENLEDWKKIIGIIIAKTFIKIEKLEEYANLPEFNKIHSLLDNQAKHRT